MSAYQTSSTSITAGSLTCPSDWDSFIERIARESQISEIWEYINPALSHPTSDMTAVQLLSPSVLQTLVKPPRPIRGAQENPMDFQTTMQFYKEDLSAYLLSKVALIAVMRHIEASIASQYAMYVKGTTNAYEILRSLQKNVKPSKHEIELTAMNQYKHTLLGPKASNINQWLIDWSRVYDLAVQADLPEIYGGRPFHAFIQAVDHIDPFWSGAKRVTINDLQENGNDLPDIKDLVRGFTNGLLKQKKLATRSGATALATL